MMKTLIVATAFLAACAQPSARMNTAPGSEFPRHAFDICDAHDSVGRCSKWRYGSGEIRPYDVPPGK